MQLGQRVEDGRRVGEIKWDDDSSTDLSTVVALLVATVICPAAAVCATQTTSWVRALFVVLAVISGLIWVVLASTFLVVAVVVAAFRAHRVTRAVDALLAVASACVGGVVGLETYESGPGALFLGPAVAAIVIGVVWSRLPSRVGRIRLVALAILGAAAAIAVGATVFF